jgi:ABC-type sugar transport system permease subunit
MIRLVVISFQRKAGDQVVFAGLSNYSRVLNDSVFFASIRNNGILIAIVVPVLVLVCLIFAVIIYKLAKGTRFFQVIIFAPYILSIAATGVLFSYLLQQNGIVNELLRRLMLGKLALDWIGSSRIAIITIALIIVWKETGFGTILFISRLETLSEEYVDAMKIDGANWWQALFNLYIPHLKGILFFYTTLIVINMLSWVFNYVFVMTGGANNTMVFEMYVYRQLFLYSNKWTGSASAVLVSIVVFGLILLQMQSRAGLSQEDTE